MRPEILFPLFQSVTALKGVGDRVAQMLERLAGERVVDLIWHAPVAAIDRRPVPDIISTVPGHVASLIVEVVAHHPSPRKGSPYRVQVRDKSDEMNLVFFNARSDYLKRMLPVGETRLISGQIEDFHGVRQMVHPDYILKSAEKGSLPPFEPVYPLTYGMTSKRLRAIIGEALKVVPELDEWMDPHLKDAQGFLSWKRSIHALHDPKQAGVLDENRPERRRLAYDELFANQLALALVRTKMRKRTGRQMIAKGNKSDLVRQSLPFKPTGAQDRAVADVIGDMESPGAMLRLLQGDVGSGKTYVALMAMLHAVDAGVQATLLAPTEILARQHGTNLAEMLKNSDVRLEVLTGRDKGKKRQEILRRLENGEIDILVGTHALIQGDVEFKDLGVAVIDEQHRFGVHQRLMLAAKGEGRLDVLVMTATPIPRTLTLAVYGEMDVSKLDEKPPGRQPVDTRVMPIERLDEVVAALQRAVSQGQRAYWVCPLVEESDNSELAAAEARHEALLQVFGARRVGLVHGRMKAQDKDEVMRRFKNGDYDILVATTVIEVGVDVPDATIMVIEQAERFGLAQLHQLRGRVGRGSGKSVCLLLRSNQLGETATARLKIMRETEDGFRIAEEDLRLRGGGELLGTKQSGTPAFRIADVAVHGDLLPAAQADARMLVEKDADLKSARGQAARVLLYLFERDAAIRLLSSG
ncbi:MAG: ATP-dependent DNA helicase RecG [Sphingomonadales bacterium]